MVRPPQPTHRGGAGTLCVHVVSLCADTKTMTCRPCLDTYIHTYKQTINQYKQIVIIHKSIETYSYTYTWLQMVRPPQPTHRGGAGTLCVHVVSLCADTKTMTCRPCWDTHILTYQQTDSQTHRHTYINQYKHIVIPIHGCICVTYPPFGGGGGGEPGGAGSYIFHPKKSQFGGFQLGCKKCPTNKNLPRWSPSIRARTSAIVSSAHRNGSPHWCCGDPIRLKHHEKSRVCCCRKWRIDRTQTVLQYIHNTL